MTELERYKAKLTRLLKHKAEEPNNTYHDWDEEIQRCKINIADEVMEEKTSWIPVSERLPEDYTKVWITIKYDAGVYRTIAGRWKGKFLWNNGRSVRLDVVAWQPYSRPEPYKPE